MIPIIISLLTLFITIYIPKKLAWEQFYNTLISEYRSIVFGKAVQNIIRFYINTCDSDISRIQKEYEQIFRKEIEDSEICNENTLHYDRRLLAQFFIDLDKCAKTRWYYIGKKRVLKDFTKGTQNIVKILYFMNNAVENSSLMYKEITFYEKIPKSTSLCGINKYLAHMSEILNQSKKYIE